MTRSVTLSRRRIALGSLAAGLLPFAARAAYPEAPIKWIVAYAAGGGTDTLARLLAVPMAEALGRPVVIDNRPGAATNIGAEAAARAAPDGYTVMSADNGTMVFNPALFRHLPYDPEQDFRPLGGIARFHLVLAVKKGSSFADVRAFMAAAKEKPGSIDYGSPGIGSPHHLAMERLARSTGTRFNHVPYRGAAPALNDLLAGVVEAAVLDTAAGGEALRSGMARPLAVFSGSRQPGFPDLPTLAEALSLQSFEAYAWQSLVTAKATPDAVAARLTNELRNALGQESVQRKFREIGVEPLPASPGQVQAMLAADRAVWVPLIRDLGIKLD
ncbi:tripartite tricarboxylate transporter substrate binding protein [Roseomonas sp. E05]|uniref:Bug family tripartite tricarboxylate transporter substrate binding protein n=1 Tax=Roseomonas sp. E05 TaxID=3046310 RepID=UPI0024B9A2C8|nr:tripartite tricarboxylate transporter substrate binding protein [Roseomonas sp. E05]MDJ0390460.1 tripartite tricarboxylate transporter substrate binding protein [Roseomonas sp. E05]